MLGLSRWTVQGGSYRTIQRFFSTVIPWAQVLWTFFREQLLDQQDTYLLAGDECVVTKAGKKTHGLDCFFSQRIEESRSRAILFHLGIGECQAAPFLSSVHGTDGAYCGRKSCQPGQKASQEGQSGRPKT